MSKYNDWCAHRDSNWFNKVLIFIVIIMINVDDTAKDTVIGKNG